MESKLIVKSALEYTYEDFKNMEETLYMKEHPLEGRTLEHLYAGGFITKTGTKDDVIYCLYPIEYGANSLLKHTEGGLRLLEVHMSDASKNKIVPMEMLVDYYYHWEPITCSVYTMKEAA